jgi:signal transduction histidine kinase
LVTELFDLTQMDEGQLRLSMEQTDLDEIVRNMIHTIDPRAQAKDITLHYEKNNSLPMIQGDYGRLSQVLFNLLDNAVRHTPPEGKIVIRTEVHKKYVKLIVQDSGSGIPEKEIPYVWERFYRVDESRARHFGGTGLGLAIVKQIIDGHQGSIELKSQEGVGTTVIVTLPILG